MLSGLPDSVTKNYKENGGRCLTGLRGKWAIAGLIDAWHRVAGARRPFAGGGEKRAASTEIVGESGAGCVGEARRKRVLETVDENGLPRDDVGSGGGGAARDSVARRATTDGGGAGASRRGGSEAAVSAGGLLLDVCLLHAGARDVGRPGVQADPGGARGAAVPGGRSGGGGGAPPSERGRAAGAAPVRRQHGGAGGRGEREEQGGDRGPVGAAGATAGCRAAAGAGGGADGAGGAGASGE